MNSHHSPEHPRFCTPQAFRSIYSFRRNRPARTTRRQSFSFAPEPVRRSVIAAKHKATMARRNAFLDLNAAVERNARYLRNKALADALGKELNPKCQPEDMEMWMNRYREAVMHEQTLREEFARTNQR
jgi:hypothetical protein